MSSVYKHRANLPHRGASFSELVCVRGLAEHAPDIASQLDSSWDDVPLTARLLEQLLISDDVVSLPPTIASDLLRLYEYYVRHRPTDSPSTRWDLPASGFRDLQPSAANCRGNS